MLNTKLHSLGVLLALTAAACGPSTGEEVTSGGGALICKTCGPKTGPEGDAGAGPIARYRVEPDLVLELGTCADAPTGPAPIANALLQVLKRMRVDATAMPVCPNGPTGLDERLGVWFSSTTDTTTDERRRSWLSSNRLRSPSEDFALSLPAASLQYLASSVGGPFPRAVSRGGTVASITAPEMTFLAPGIVTSRVLVTVPWAGGEWTSDLTSVDTLSIDANREVLASSSTFHFNQAGVGLIDSLLESLFVTDSDREDLAVGGFLASALPVAMLTPNSPSKTHFLYRRGEYVSATRWMVFGGSVRTEARQPALAASAKDRVATTRGIQSGVEVTLTKDVGSQAGLAQIFLSSLDLRASFVDTNNDHRADKVTFSNVTWSAGEGIVVTPTEANALDAATAPRGRPRTWTDFRFGDGAPRVGASGNGLIFDVSVPFVVAGRSVVSRSVTFTVTDFDRQQASITVIFKADTRPTNCALKPFLPGCSGL